MSPGSAASTAAVTGGAEIEIPDAPPITGLHFRHIRMPDDYPGMVRVTNAARDAYGVIDRATVEGAANEYEHPSNFDPRSDITIAEIDDLIVAYSIAVAVDVNGGGRSYDSVGRLDPAWSRHGIGIAMLHHNERHLRERARREGETHPRWFGSWHWDRDAAGRALLLSEGYVPVRWFHDMVRPTLDDLPDAPLPAGLEVRPATDATLRAIFDADVEAFLDHWGESDGSDAAFDQWVSSPDFDPTLLQTAWDGDEVAGVVIGGIHGAENAALGVRRVWLESVGVRRPWRRRGLARALMGRCMAIARDRGMTSAALGVDAGNPSGALRLYRDLGFEVVGGATAYRKAFDADRGPEWSDGPGGGATG